MLEVLPIHEELRSDLVLCLHLEGLYVFDGLQLRAGIQLSMHDAAVRNFTIRRMVSEDLKAIETI